MKVKVYPTLEGNTPSSEFEGNDSLEKAREFATRKSLYINNRLRQRSMTLEMPDGTKEFFLWRRQMRNVSEQQIAAGFVVHRSGGYRGKYTSRLLMKDMTIVAQLVSEARTLLSSTSETLECEKFGLEKANEILVKHFEGI